MGLQAKWGAKPCRTRPACEGAVVPRRAFISWPDQLPGGLRSPGPSRSWAFGPEEASPAQGFPGAHLLCSSTKLTISSLLLGLSGMVTGSSVKAS